MKAKSVDCRCTYNFTCGHCLKNAPVYFWTDSAPAERFARVFGPFPYCNVRKVAHGGEMAAEHLAKLQR